jgi:tRNA (mo5U34)-methyltransferase
MSSSLLSGLSKQEIQAKIDRVPWYHEYDFPGGFRAKSSTPDTADHRALWGFLHEQLDKVDFKGKRVLEIGSWDGYWSFDAEKRGAARVLSTDDLSQNWSAGEGIQIARELLGSKIEVRQDVSVYSLKETLASEGPFDIIIYLGVYYHLFDPYYAFTQIRHLCGPDTIVLIDGPEGPALPEGTACLNFANHAIEFLPSKGALEQLVEAAYLTIEHRAEFNTDKNQPADTDPVGRKWRLRQAALALFGSREKIRQHAKQIEPYTFFARRVFFHAKGFQGASRLHAYKPPFGLECYDDRFNGQTPITP